MKRWGKVHKGLALSPSPTALMTANRPPETFSDPKTLKGVNASTVDLGSK